MTAPKAVEQDVKMAEGQALCLSEASTLALRRKYGKSPHRRATILDVRTAMLLVKPVGFRGAVWADLETGSLYDRKSLRCLTGDIRLKWCEEVSPCLKSA